MSRPDEPPDSVGDSQGILQFPIALAADPTSALTIAREKGLSRLLMAYVVSGLFFMLLPGTFLGVWNLLSISSARAAQAVSPSWLQAHGHAQIFGWIGSFILGIGFYSIPKLRRGPAFAPARGWMCWGGWTVGVALRWLANTYLWHWRALLPVSAGLELLAFLIFFRAVSGHRPAQNAQAPFEPWIVVVIGATLGMFSTLTMNLAGCVIAAMRQNSPAFPVDFDHRYLVLSTWGFLVPFVWGFSSRWLPIFLGLQPLRSRWLLAGLFVTGIGVITSLFGSYLLSEIFLLTGAGCSLFALRLFEPAQQAPRIRGVHASFPFFVRSAYGWLLLSGVLGLWAANTTPNAGILGASRHALTVGFLALMVFCIGPRVLPAFSGMRTLWSTALMFLSLALLSLGCLLRVSSEVLAYQGIWQKAWSALPISAFLELSAILLFAVNLFSTLLRSSEAPAPR